MNGNLFRDTVRLKIHSGDNSDYTADFDEYILSSVRVVERIGTSAEMVEKNAVDVYFFPSFSSCANADGTKAPLPHAGYGDIAVITLDGETKEMRVSYVARHDSIGEASHVRIRLE